MNAPLIGITAIGPAELPFTTAHNVAFHSSPVTYSDCVQRAGGIPVFVPAMDGDMAGLLDRLDGIIFSGGTDIHPDLYRGKADHPDVLTPDLGRDRFEIDLMGAVVARADLPILAICRGVQVLNVALGGSLLEHLPDHIDDDFHRGGDGLWGIVKLTVFHLDLKCSS